MPPRAKRVLNVTLASGYSEHQWARDLMPIGCLIRSQASFRMLSMGSDSKAAASVESPLSFEWTAACQRIDSAVSETRRLSTCSVRLIPV